MSEAFNQELADTYLGKYILVGITYLDHTGMFIEREQFHGVLEKATSIGIEIALKGTRDGQIWKLPPDLSSVRIAPAGTYKLRETGEEIENPDLLTTWTVTRPAPGEAPT